MGNNLNKIHIDRIDAFEKGNLNSLELQSFRQDLSLDEQLAEDFNYIQTLKTALKQQQKERLINTFKSWDQSSSMRPQDHAAKVTLLNPRRRWMAIAASFLFLALAGWWMLSSNPEAPSNLALFDQYFSPYPTTSQERSSTSEKGFMLYDLKKYDLAAESLQESNDPNAKFYLANAYLVLGEPNNAISALNDYQGNRFGSTSNWYLALAYLKSNRMDEAINLLEQLAAENNPYSFKAAKVLQALAK